MTITLDTTWQVDNPDDSADCTPAQVRARLDAYRAEPPAYNAEILGQYVDEGFRVARLARGRASLGFSQSFHETAGLRFGGQVQPHQLNFGGLGATNDGAQGGSFKTVRDGWMAFWAHHMSYWWGALSSWPAWAERFKPYAYRNQAVLDAGYGGVVVSVGDYRNGRWAWSPQYPRGSLQNGYAWSIRDGANAILALPRGEAPMTAQIPGFAWEPADTDHFQRGRTARIRGVAIHYTAGTSSLHWLTKTSVPPVSATFLIKPDATMDDRGWQMVRIEDTPWTTAFANAYTASIEVEHDGNGPLPTHLYPIIAQTVIDIAEYVEQHNLGFVPLDRGGIKPHKEWVNNPALICSDGVDTNLVVAAVQDIRQIPPPENALYLPANPFGEIPVVLGFRALYLDTGEAKYPENPVLGGLSLYGYPEGPEFVTSFGSAQIFERAVFKFFAGANPPWDLVIAHRTEPVPERSEAA